MRAIVFGGTGLVGGLLLKELLSRSEVESVLSFSRKPIDLSHPKLKQVSFDASNILEKAEALEGNHVFCCLGTTIAKAGSREAFAAIDKELVLRIARISAMKGIVEFSLVSAKGAHLQSPFFYFRVKAEVEAELSRIPFRRLLIYRPGLLLGARKDLRPLEALGVRCAHFARFLGFKFGTSAQELAKKMCDEALNKEKFGREIFETF